MSGSTVHLVLIPLVYHKSEERAFWNNAHFYLLPSLAVVVATEEGAHVATEIWSGT